MSTCRPASYENLVINYDYDFGSPFPLQLSLAEIGRLDNRFFCVRSKHSQHMTGETIYEHRFRIA